MAETRNGSSRTLALVGAAAVAAAFVALAVREQYGGPAGVSAEGDAAVAALPEAGVEAGAPGPDAVAEPAPEADAAEAATAPSFDIVRVSPEGAALVAGRAAPGARVTVRAGETEVAEVEADAGGEFVAIFRAPAAEAPQALSLESEGTTGGAVSEETVLLLPPAPPAAVETAEAASAEAGWAPATAAVEGEPEPEETAAAAPVETAVAPEASSAEAAPVEAPAVAATAILRDDEVEVIEAAPPPGPRRVSLASISYGEAGLVTLAGFGTAGSAVRVYVDGTHAVDGEIDPGGRWRLALGEIAAGVYRLRVDEIGPDGQVASRVETPFQRDFPELAPAPGEGEAEVTVQPGNNLWTIARERYGQGIHYTQIFTANAALIRDPELIYPGQIFVLPVVEGAGEPVVEGPLPRP
jgi:nucleoid-associated protein YgaU